MDAQKQGNFFPQNKGTFFVKSGHCFSFFKKGQRRPPPLPRQLRVCTGVFYLKVICIMNLRNNF